MSGRACKVCGKPTTSKYEICGRTKACRAAWYRSAHHCKPKVACRNCGRPTISRTGYCTSTPACKAWNNRMYYDLRLKVGYGKRPTCRGCPYLDQSTGQSLEGTRASADAMLAERARAGTTVTMTSGPAAALEVEL